MHNITLEDITFQVRRLHDAYVAMGWLTAEDKIAIHQGSGSYNLSWRLTIEGTTDRLPGVELDGVFTKRQACDTLRVAANMAAWAAHAKNM